MTDTYAAPSDLADWLEMEFTPAQSRRAQLLIEGATAVIDAEAGQAFSSPPNSIKIVCLSCAARAFTNPGGVEAETAGPFSATYRADNLYLTAAEKKIVANEVDDGVPGVWVLGTTRGEVETGRITDQAGGGAAPLTDAYGNEYLEQTGGGDPIIYRAPGDPT